MRTFLACAFALDVELFTVDAHEFVLPLPTTFLFPEPAREAAISILPRGTGSAGVDSGT